MMVNSTKTARPLGVVHLIFGIVFSGIATIWLIAEANDTEAFNLAVGIPVVLIGAGIIGLAAIVVNQRRAKASAAVSESVATADPVDLNPPEADLNNDTTTLTTDKDQS